MKDSACNFYATFAFVIVNISADFHREILRNEDERSGKQHV